MFEFIYVLFEIKFNVFKKYLNTNLKKKYIQKFESSIKYSIFFTFKKNDKFYLCVDYWKLNDITIKNKYSLFNINKFQNKLQKTKYFIKINLRETYNLIYIKKNEKQFSKFNINITNIWLCCSNLRMFWQHIKN